MKRTYKIFWVMLSVMALFITGSFSVMATTMETQTTVEEKSIENSSETEVENDNIGAKESVSGVDVTGQNNTVDGKQGGESVTEESDVKDESENIPSLEDNGETVTEEDKVIDLEQLLSETTKKTGLYYYIQKYQNDCKAVYLQKYIEYMSLQVIACKNMYELGDTTEAVLKSYEAQKAIAEAELQTSYNESEYNNLYLKKNNLDYSDHNMKELKNVESIEYYMEHYPEKDYMTLARYVTDYNNGIAGMKAKEIEIEALKTEVGLAKLLFEEGEISKIEYVEKEVSLALAQYELEEYYVKINMAYYNLVTACGDIE